MAHNPLVLGSSPSGPTNESRSIPEISVTNVDEIETLKSI